MNQWPPKSKIQCFNSNHELIAKSYRGKIDLADELMLNHSSSAPKVAFLSVKTKANSWDCWDKENVGKIEQHITYDLNFDGYEVKIRRLSKVGSIPCEEEFCWELEITEEVLQEEKNERDQIPKRFKVARSDASIKSIQRKIEKIFGLPGGSVKLVKRSGKKADDGAKIKDFRDGWKRG
jgi:ribosomal protein L23